MSQHRCMGCMALTEQSVCEHCGHPQEKQNEPHQLPVGTLLRGQYLVGKVLGQGGFGITYLGWDTYLDIPVAIKEYYPNSMVNRECTQSLAVHCYTEQVRPVYTSSKDRFLREAKALAKFDEEPAIVRIKSFFPENETAYIVMEYVRGTSLLKYIGIRGGRLSMEETLRILKPVMEALETVHKTGMIHRDISPDNIVLHPRGGAKLLDFGAVRAVDNPDADKVLTRSTEAILKHGFAPMEQYQNRGSLGPWTDVYALCATIYYCVTGRIPEDAPARMMEEKDPDWSIVPGITAEQKAALEKGMALRAKNRISSVEELMAALYSAEVSAAVATPEQVQEKPKPRLEVEKVPLAPVVEKSLQEEKAAIVPRKKKTPLRWLLPVGIVILAAAVLYLLPKRGWNLENGKYTYYNWPNQKLSESWLAENGRYFYFDEDGFMLKGWLQQGEKTYFFGEDGRMVTGWRDISGDTYYFGDDGIMVTGWRDFSGEKYYFGSDGKLTKGWHILSGRRMYFGEKGALCTGWQTIGGFKYYFGDDGLMHTNWSTISGEKYYFGSDGKMRDGWQSISGIKFYFGNDGVMRTGWQKIQGDTYFFSTKGVMCTGWQTIGMQTYYFDLEGKMHTGWLDLWAYKYYFTSKGVMCTGYQVIDGRTYYFDENGRLIR